MHATIVSINYEKAVTELINKLDLLFAILAVGLYFIDINQIGTGKQTS